MHPKKSLLCSVCLAFLAFLLWSSISRTETLSNKIKRFVQREADTVFSFSPETRNYIFFNAGYSLAVREKDTLRKGLDPRFTLIDFTGKVVWDTTLAWWNVCELTSDKIASPKVVLSYALYEGWGATEIFNTNGLRLAKVEEESSLRASPGGVYFFSTPSGMEPNPLNVYDSLGVLLWTDTAKAELGLVTALSDSFLLYATAGKLFTLDPKGGKSELTLTGDMKVPPFSLGGLSVAQNGRFFALYGNPYLENPTVLSFSKEGVLLWDAAFEKKRERMYGVVFSPGGRFLSMLRAYREKPTARELQFRDNLNKGKLIWKTEFDEGRGPIESVLNSVTIFDSLLTIVLPSGYDYFYNKGLSSDTKTKCIFFDPINGSITDSFTVEGFLTRVDSRVFGTHYFLAVYNEESRKIFVLRSK